MSSSSMQPSVYCGYPYSFSSTIHEFFWSYLCCSIFLELTLHATFYFVDFRLKLAEFCLACKMASFGCDQFLSCYHGSNVSFSLYKFCFLLVHNILLF
uniref:Uncharacterized protein n=1 Tax=Oryza punctata TaxID=4537 RepID=A0A0E0MFT1_ORYPU